MADLGRARDAICPSAERSRTSSSTIGLLHHAHIMRIAGDSYRLRDKRKAGHVKARATNWKNEGRPGGSVLLQRLG
jgi:hypothetical protein